MATVALDELQAGLSRVQGVTISAEVAMFVNSTRLTHMEAIATKVAIHGE